MGESKPAPAPCCSTGQGIICAGLPRSGTLSLATALDILGVGPIQHGLRDTSTREAYAWSHAAWCSFPCLRSRLASRDSKLPFYLPPRYRCTTDVGSMFSEQLISAYPDAKVILVERPVDRWARSYGRVLIDKTYCGIGGFIKCRLGPWADCTTTTAYFDVSMGWLGTFSRREAHHLLPVRHREHYEMDGWGPLCKFLRLPVPDVPFPHVNEEGEFLSMLRGLDSMILSRLAQKLVWSLLAVSAAASLSRPSTRRLVLHALRRTFAI
ncbi:hypothetical protein LEL_05255 [Akanthomyces lecanii RCEF 1005]|uniref:NAD dependent epimerase/dehydratase n=1 Tax=Akanthomyces lecanii RCEF 1005 TaxID=1081108 RepID=A0A162K662_CORDF|nr:hypothetical protein LEL_05255 [Akanthomyces lecanii RCEF 1005]